MNPNRRLTSGGVLLLVVFMSIAAETTIPRASAPAYRRRADDEPLRSFHLLDDQLSLLGKQVALLQSTLKDAGGAVNLATASRPWTRQARQMQAVIGSVETIALRLRRRYRNRRFGARLFNRLHARAAAVRERVAAVSAARDAPTANSATAQLNRQMLALVLQYDRISGGYGALHCSAGEWACCEPKREPGGRRSADACRWLCTPAPKRCTGFLGPHIPRR